jgi:ATP-dependent helicase/nuclease subunit A
MSEPSDQRERERFSSELDRNFSVVAAAGSGKTRALTDRIVAIARSDHALEWLPQLVVVTYTNRAANEMQQRARAEMLKAKVNVSVLSAFNQAFFGTIHSFCVKLLNAHGHVLGLPSQLDLVTEDEELWNDFVQRQGVIGRALSDEARAILLRYVEARRLLELGKRGGISADAAFDNEPCPDVNLDALLRYRPKGSSVDNITRTQDHLREWDRVRRTAIEFFPLPLRGSEAKDFVALWDEAFGPFRDWLSRAALCVAAEVERDYRAYRLTKGVLTYADQVELALELFRNPDAARRIRSHQYRVILDEAQDTGTAQFGVLLESTRPPEARGFWPDEPGDPPQPGHFCMVGDFQQSIFSQHANLPHYRRIHEALIAAKGGAKAEFSVSFRLDERGIEFINETFSHILEGDGQVDFLKMHPRPEALPGQILRVDLVGANFAPRTPVRRKAAWEARELARWIRHAGLKNLRAASWRDVAILCPRKLWFAPLRDALQREGLEVEVQSETEVKGDSPAYAWLSALLTVMAAPSESYEIVGVLRELFGLSDHDLAVFAEGRGSRFDLLRKHDGEDPVSAKLRLLRQVRNGIAGQPLFTAVQEVIKTTHLRERLQSLPAGDFDHLDDELESLLASTARAEAEGMSLTDFARYLRDDFVTVRDAPAARREAAIQLITSHKAKGSEWQAVIVPFLMREVDSRAGNFPRVTNDRMARAQRILFHKEEITPEMKAEAETIERQEMERLLYVALTRAKHTLVLAGAPGLYATSKHPQPTKSQIKWLRCEEGGCNEEAFARLSNEARAEEKTATRHAALAAEKTQAQKLAALPKVKASPREAALQFPRKVSPSGLIRKATASGEADVEELNRAPVFASLFENEATRYGGWWHSLLETIDWNGDPAEWDANFAVALPGLSQDERARDEWKLLRAHLSGSEDFRKRLGADSFLAHAEVPFSLKLDSTLALEGVIDLVLINPAAGRALVLDWKTNQMQPNETASLLAKYRPQLAAYREAVRRITGLKVEAALYSTASGKLLIYGDDALTAEWSRLARLPAGEIGREVAPDNF